MILVDDHLLAARLRDDGFGPGSNPIATTCCWWWRLPRPCTAVGAAPSPVASATGISRPPTRVDDLAETVAVLDLRACCRDEPGGGAFRLNLLAAEALVAAEVLRADIVVGQDTPRLREAARVRGVTYLVEA